MQFRIADIFTDGFAELTGEEQNAVKTTLEAEIDQGA